MPDRHDVPVLIAGAGPIGLTLAADLAWRNIPSLIVDPQEQIVEHPRAISIGVRSMEHFRRIGLDQHVIDAGVPREQVLDVVFVTRMLGKEIFRFKIPSIDQLSTRSVSLQKAIPETAASPYYKTWTAQAPLECMLRQHVQYLPQTELRVGWTLMSFQEHTDSVTAVIRDNAGQHEETLTAAFLAGCDGARSRVREGLGINMQGRGTLGGAMGFYFRAPELRARLGADAGVMYWMLAPDCGGTIYTIDGGDEWVFNRYFNSQEEANNVDPLRSIHAAIGEPLNVEVISALDWQPRQLVARSFGSERAFLAGDACHLFVPTGGLGMNTGIGDAADLAWKIQAVLEGWGGPALLPGYDRERRPIGEQNTLEAADNYDRSRAIQAYPEGLEEETARGEAARTSIAVQLPPKIKHFAPIGMHLGYCYENSPLVVADGTPIPPHEPASYKPTTRPGHRAPHAWLQADRSTLDWFGDGFVLICTSGSAAEASGLVEAARSSGVPIRIETIDEPKIVALYEKRFVLVRPDGHVCWRADEPPTDPDIIVQTVTGRLR